MGPRRAQYQLTDYKSAQLKFKLKVGHGPQTTDDRRPDPRRRFDVVDEETVESIPRRQWAMEQKSIAHQAKSLFNG
jgi:hypothetical protein